jgi:hypothetical protein
VELVSECYAVFRAVNQAALLVWFVWLKLFEQSLVFIRWLVESKVGLAALSCGCWVASLDHEARNKAMKLGPVEVLLFAELQKVFGRLRNLVCMDLDAERPLRGQEHDLAFKLL